MSTVAVTLCDAAYFGKASVTIKDLRTRGRWTGPIVLVAVDFTPDPGFLTQFNIQPISFPRIPLDRWLTIRKEIPYSITTDDGREFKKVTQWEKLHLFDPFFKQWERVIFFDAGLRIVDSLDNFLCLEWRGKFLAQDDTWNDRNKKYRCQLELVKQPDVFDEFVKTFGADILEKPFFLNCMWVHDTSIPITKEELLDTMNRFPIWHTNEMALMNAVIGFKYGLWTPFPLTIPSGKYLFEWCELNRQGTNWTQYCALKYCVTLK
jgi:hypothetical protein